MELSEQLTQFQERLLDQTEDVQRANAQMEMLKREQDKLNVAHEQQMRQLVDERSQLQVHSFTFIFIVTELTVSNRTVYHHIMDDCRTA